MAKACYLLWPISANRDSYSPYLCINQDDDGRGSDCKPDGTHNPFIDAPFDLHGPYFSCKCLSTSDVDLPSGVTSYIEVVGTKVAYGQIMLCARNVLTPAYPQEPKDVLIYIQHVYSSEFPAVGTLTKSFMQGGAGSDGTKAYGDHFHMSCAYRNDGPIYNPATCSPTRNNCGSYGGGKWLNEKNTSARIHEVFYFGASCSVSTANPTQWYIKTYSLCEIGEYLPITPEAPAPTPPEIISYYGAVYPDKNNMTPHPIKAVYVSPDGLKFYKATPWIYTSKGWKKTFYNP